MQGTKRFTDKSGEYYLKNIQLQNSKIDPNSHKKMSLNNPQNLENCLNRNIDRIKKRASRIVTLLPENSLTPIPKKDGRNTGMADRYGKKELKDAERTAVFIRRMEYATSMKRQMDEDKNMKNQAKKIALIQEWWKTMFKIIKLQKNMRGFLFRKKLMSNLEHQEKLLQFITEFDNIHSYHLYKQFMDNLKKKRDYENSKMMEKCEDFNEKLDNLEKLHNLKNLRNCFDKWKNESKRQKKDDLDNLAKKLNDLLTNKINENKKDALDQIKNKAYGDDKDKDEDEDEDEELNDKIKDFQDKYGRNKVMRDIIRAHRLNKLLNNVKNKLDEKKKREALEKLKQKNDIERAGDKLKKLMEDNLKRKAWNDLKTMDFVDKLDDIINKHNNEDIKDAKKEFLDKLKDLNDKNKLKDKLKKWKGFNDEMNNRMKILNKLIRRKNNDLRKKAEQDKNNLCISSGINDFEIISDKKQDKDAPRNSQVFISPQNDINILGNPTPESESPEQNSSLPPSDSTFKFFDPPQRSKKLNLKSIQDQIDNIKSFKDKEENKNDSDNLDNKPNEEENDDKDNPENDNEEKKPEEKKEIDNKGFDILDKLFNNKLKKDALDKLKKNADTKRALEDLDKLLTDKLKKKLMDNLKMNSNINKAVNILDNLAKLNAKKQFLDKLKNNNNLEKGMQILDKLFNNKIKKDTFNKLKKNDKINLGANNLEKLITNKLRRKFLDRLSNDKENAFNKLDKIFNNHLKKYGFDTLKKNNNLVKGVQKLDKLIKDKNDKTKRDTFDKLKKNNEIAKPVNILDKLLNNKLKKDAFDKLKKNDDIAKNLQKLDKLINNKLKDDTFYKLKTMDFVDILKKMKNKNDDNNKKENFDKLMNNLKEMKNKGKEDEKNNLKNEFDHWKTIKELRDILDLFKKKKYFDKWLGNCEIKEILTSFKELRNTNKKKLLLDILQNLDDKKKNNDLKKYFDKWKDIALKPQNKTKRISHRRNPKKTKVKTRKKPNYDKRLLRRAFNKWKKISSFADTRDVLEGIKRNRLLNNDEKQDNDLLSKYKNKVLRVILNIYKDQNLLLLKKSFDKWRRTSGPDIKKEYTKYRKKPRILDTEDDYDDENNNNELNKDSFRPTHIVSSKQNIYGIGRPYNINSYDSFNERPIPTFNYLNQKPNLNKNNQNLPYRRKYDDKGLYYDYPYNNPEDFRRKYGQKMFDYEQPNPENLDYYNYDLIPNIRRDKEIHVIPRQNINYEERNPKDNYYKELDQQAYSESSINDSLMSGVTLIQNFREIKQPRNYTSQSFFIDKNSANNLAKNNDNYQLNTHNPNQQPMTMKGDFVSLIENNPKVLAQKNPRIQVTNATCDLNEIINDENNDEEELNIDEVNSEMDKLKNNYIIDKNKVLTKVIQHCDKDLYASQKPFVSKKDQWYSVSIPLNDNEAKWEFLNGLKGERDKNNLNKFELIQNEIDSNKIEEEPYNTKTFKSIRSERKKNPVKENRDNSYKLREMNFSQFYRSPNRSRNKITNDAEKSYIGGGSFIKRPGKNKKMHSSLSYMDMNRRGNRNFGSNNIERNKGKIQFNPRFKSINYDDEDEYNFSDE